jgi:2-amino-4-hydroxy-6-hydroxymethyldihydropteridine diphosphokinase
MGKTYYLSLGSNLGDKIYNLRRAVNWLKESGDVISMSSVYKTSPVDMDAGTEPFLNLVLAIFSTLEPEEMLHRIKGFEGKMGRSESGSDYAPRIIDIDILMVDGLLISKPNLTVPHPRMTSRAFVLVPLNEIAPHVVDPVSKKRVTDILNDFQSDESIEKCPDKLRF